MYANSMQIEEKEKGFICMKPFLLLVTAIGFKPITF
ncbi:MAG: hypothetical protein JWM28_282 [Chitinophagaceae bacterium]|nr:hypothetical protein [Chitinophagaceae bacterium]